MTLRNFDPILKNASGTPNKFTDETGSQVELTGSQVIRNCLMNGPIGEDGRPRSVVPDRKRKMFNLANKLDAKGDIDIDTDESGIIAQCIEHLPPLIYGQIDIMLNRDLAPKEGKKS